MLRYAVTAAVLVWSGAAAALSPAEQRGFTFVKENCSGCHAIGPSGVSPLPIAPPFRTLHLRYPVEDLADLRPRQPQEGRQAGKQAFVEL